jgi:hypothetical protein
VRVLRCKAFEITAVAVDDRLVVRLELAEGLGLE